MEAPAGETVRGKDRFKNRDLFADERCSQAILDSPAITDVGRRIPGAAEEDAQSEASERDLREREESREERRLEAEEMEAEAEKEAVSFVLSFVFVFFLRRFFYIVGEPQRQRAAYGLDSGREPGRHDLYIIGRMRLTVK